MAAVTRLVLSGTVGYRSAFIRRACARLSLAVGSSRSPGNLSISNVVYQDSISGQSPVSDVPVLALDAATGWLIGKTVSGVGGAYSFHGLSADPVIVLAVDLTVGRISAVEAPVIPD